MTLKKRSILGRELLWEEVDQNWSDIEQNFTQKANTVHTHNISSISGLQNALDLKIGLLQKGAVNGVATLDGAGKIPLSQLPELPATSPSENIITLPHSTLTSADIGKLTIWKDGNCQLPVFEPEILEEKKVVSTSFHKNTYDNFVIPHLSFQLTGLPADGDNFQIPVKGVFAGMQHEYFTYKNSPVNSREIEIGADVESTIANTVSAISSYLTAPSISIEGVSHSNFSIIYNALFEYGTNFDFTGNIFSGVYANGSNISISKNGETLSARIKDPLKGFMMICVMKIDYQWITNEISYNRSDIMEWFCQSPHFSQTVYRYGADSDTLLRLPIDFTEFKNGMKERLEMLSSIDAAEWIDEELQITIHNENMPVAIDSSNDGYNIFNNAFSDFTTISDWVPPIPRHCQYPIVGTLKSVSSTHCEISTDSLQEFTLTGTDELDYDAFFGLGKYCVLNPDAPGYVTPLTNIEIQSFQGLVGISRCGYIQSLDREVESHEVFLGYLSRDTYMLSILYLLVSSED